LCSSRPIDRLNEDVNCTITQVFVRRCVEAVDSDTLTMLGGDLRRAGWML
jgi:hypothetical protein